MVDYTIFSEEHITRFITRIPAAELDYLLMNRQMSDKFLLDNYAYLNHELIKKYQHPSETFLRQVKKWQFFDAD